MTVSENAKQNSLFLSFGFGVITHLHPSVLKSWLTKGFNDLKYQRQIIFPFFFFFTIPTVNSETRMTFLVETQAEKLSSVSQHILTNLFKYTGTHPEDVCTADIKSFTASIFFYNRDIMVEPNRQINTKFVGCFFYHRRNPKLLVPLYQQQHPLS